MGRLGPDSLALQFRPAAGGKEKSLADTEETLPYVSTT